LLDINLIKRVLYGYCSRGERNACIDLCFKIARNHLSFSYHKISSQLFKRELELEDIAIEALTPLFQVNENNELVKLINAFEGWKPAIKTGTDSLFFLTKIVQNRVEQHIICVLKNSDPHFTKIFNALNYQIRKNGYEKQSIFGTVYIVKKALQKFDKQFINCDEFESLSFQDFLKDKNLLSNIFIYLKNSKKYLPAIPLNLLIYKLKSFDETKFVSNPKSDESSEKIALDDLIIHSVKATQIKLRETYLNKNKLSKKEIMIFKKVIVDLGNDLKDGGVNRGLYEYFYAHSPKVTRKKYADEYQNILEYLLKTLKNEIKMRLRDSQV